MKRPVSARTRRLAWTKHPVDVLTSAAVVLEVPPGGHEVVQMACLNAIVHWAAAGRVELVWNALPAVEATGVIPPGNAPGEKSWQQRRVAAAKPEIRLTPGKGIQDLNCTVTGAQSRARFRQTGKPADAHCVAASVFSRMAVPIDPTRLADW